MERGAGWCGGGGAGGGGGARGLGGGGGGSYVDRVRAVAVSATYMTENERCRSCTHCIIINTFR